MSNTHKHLFEKNLISKEQFELLDAVNERRIVSLFYELRLILYLGIMLLTAGIGYIAYQNIGEFGHLAFMALIAVCIGVCAYYIFKFAKPYSNELVKVDHIYFDHVLLLSSLLLVSLFTYIQVYFDIVDLMINWTSYLSAVLFFVMAYRYDHRGVLSLGITALAAAFGLSVSPVNWVQGEWMDYRHVYGMSIALGLFFVLSSQFLKYKNIKSHFVFTYQNFGLLLFYFGMLALVFDSGYELLVATITTLITWVIMWLKWREKEFLLFLYSCIAAYIAFTYLVVYILMEGDAEILLMYYFPVTCIGFVVFLVSKKSHFSND